MSIGSARRDTSKNFLLAPDSPGVGQYSSVLEKDTIGGSSKFRNSVLSLGKRFAEKA
jgi:hypothetical protein